MSETDSKYALNYVTLTIEGVSPVGSVLAFARRSLSRVGLLESAA